MRSVHSNLSWRADDEGLHSNQSHSVEQSAVIWPCALFITEAHLFLSGGWHFFSLFRTMAHPAAARSTTNAPIFIFPATAAARNLTDIEFFTSAAACDTRGVYGDYWAPAVNNMLEKLSRSSRKCHA